MKQWRTSLILLGVLGILVGVAYWEDLKTKKDEIAAKDKNKLTTYTITDVKSVVFVTQANNSPQTIKFAKNEDKWLITEPVNAAAEGQAVETLVKAITDYKYESEMSAAKDRWKEFGLEPAKHEVTLLLQDGKEFTVSVGEKTPVGWSVYLRRSGSDNVLIGPQQLMTATDKKLNDFRDKTFVPFKADELIQLQVKTKKLNLSVSRKTKEEKFAFATKQDFELDPDTLGDFISSIATEKATDFAESESKLLADFAPAKRLATIDWKSADGKQGVLMFTESNKATYAAIDPKMQIWKVGDSIKGKFERELASFRNKSVFRFESANVVAVEVDGDKYTKEGGDWKKEGETDKAKTFQFIQNLVVDLEFAKTESFPTAASVKDVLKNAPKHSIKLGFNKEKNLPEISMNVWTDPKDANMVYLRHSGSAQIFRMNKTVFDRVKPEPEATSTLGKDVGKPDVEDQDGTDEM